MATHLSKTALHQLGRLGTILKQGWAHPKNPARSPPIPNKHPSNSPSSGPTENPQGNPHPIPRAPSHPIFQPLARLHRLVGVHQEISNQTPNHIAQIRSKSKISHKTSMARPEHTTNYRSSLIPTPQLPRKATPPRVVSPPRVEHPAMPQRFLDWRPNTLQKKTQRIHSHIIRTARRRQ